MDDREFVLGVLVVMFIFNFYENYIKDGREEFLDNGMKKINGLFDLEIKIFENKFRNIMIIC